MARKSRKNADVGIASTSMTVQKPIFRVGAYVRMSVEDKKQKGNSIENQQSIINAYIEEHTDLELAEVYIDNGLSGQFFDRPAFTQMIADMESGKINCCITKDLSRLGRNAIDTGFYIEKFFPTKGIRYIAITDNYDSADPKSGGVMISLKNMINEAYALEASRKVKATIRMNIKNGCFIGGLAPYGYFKSENDCHKLVVDPYAAGIVRTMYEMAESGQSHGTILAWLNDNDIMPPMRYLHSLGLATANNVGANTQWWSLRAVRDILRNRMYCGVMVQGKKRMEGGVQVTLPKSEWTITENTHEAVISREVFAEVQKFWDKPNTDKEPYYKGENTEDVFRAKIYCGDCGSQMFRKRITDRAYSYLCTKSVQYTTRACGGMRTTESLVRAAVLGQILESGLTTLPPSPIPEVTPPPDSDIYKAELAKTKADAEKNSRFLKGLYESLKLGDIFETEYRELKSTYELRVTSLAEQENALKMKIQDSIQREKALEQARNSTLSVKTVADLTKEVVAQTVEKITVYEKTNIAVDMRCFEADAVLGKEGISNE
jgi:DNA invertase Pin-like site-specific DNA recombinase